MRPCCGILIALPRLFSGTLALINLALLLFGSLLGPLRGFPLPVRTRPTRITPHHVPTNDLVRHRCERNPRRQWRQSQTIRLKRPASRMKLGFQVTVATA
jgi:hypothetical protein